MKPSHFDTDWPYLQSLLPAGFEGSARSLRAFQRKREIRDAASLLRLLLNYIVDPKPSFRCTAAWAELAGLASVSQVSVHERLFKAKAWLAHLVQGLLLEQVQRPELQEREFRLRLIDATCLSAPGSNGTDYRLHVSWDLASLTLEHVELTEASGGESLTRFDFQPGDLVMGDRGYAHRRGLAKLVESKAYFLVRFCWQNLPLQQEGEPFDLLAELRKLMKNQVGDFSVQIAASSETPALTARVLAVRKSRPAAQKSRAKARKDAKRKGRKLDPRTLEAADYLYVVTNLSPEQLSAREALALYRFRWQIELLFKRWKSLFEIKKIPVQKPEAIQAFLYGKLLILLLVGKLREAAESFSPWGYGLPEATDIAVAAGAAAAGASQSPAAGSAGAGILCERALQAATSPGRQPQKTSPAALGSPALGP